MHARRAIGLDVFVAGGEELPAELFTQLDELRIEHPAFALETRRLGQQRLTPGALGEHSRAHDFALGHQPVLAGTELVVGSGNAAQERS